MTFSRHLLAAAGAAALLAGCATSASAPDAPASTAEIASTTAAAATGAGRTWAHQGSDLTPDPAARFGVLPNGMRYILYRNATPATEASLRLHIDAGSTHERDDQQGVAHFLEHMVLNGTTNVPEGEFIRRLERAGLRFGPDTNASTEPDKTIYKLDLPETDAATIDTALLLLREVAGEATLDAGAIDRERGIILSEERTRNTPNERAQFRKRWSFLFKGQRLPNRLPIGSTDVIRNAPRERFVEFYQAFYRPERATLIAVGDFDPAEMERKIVSRFSDWRGRGPAGRDPDLGGVAPRETEALVIVEPGANEQAAITWLAPPERRADTRAVRREKTLQTFGLLALNNRLERLANSAAPPFTISIAARNTIYDTADSTDLIVVPQPGRWRQGLGAAEQEQRRLVQYGVTQAELNRVLASTRGRLTAAAAGAGTRRTPSLAEALLADLVGEDVTLTPADDLAMFEAVAKEATPELVSTAVRTLFQGSGPLLTLVSQAPVETGEQALLEAFNQSRQLAVAAPSADAVKTWTYTNFGAPGTVAERREAPEYGATLIRFGNGVRLTVRPSQARKDQILVNVRVGDGKLDVPVDRPSPELGLQLGGFTLGGLGRLTSEELDEALAGRVYSAVLAAGDDAFVLSGVTRPTDFALQMQVLAAYLTDAAYRPAGWERVRTFAGTIHDQLEGTPGGVFQRDSDALLRSGDRRWVLPSREEIAASRIDDVRAIVQPAFAAEPITVVITGDVTVDEAVRQTAATFGALPPRRPMSTSPAAARRIAFPTSPAQPVRRTHKGRADQALAMIAWPTADFYADPRRARTLNLLSDVLQLRLEEEIREKQGTTYSPSAGHEASDDFAGYGYMAAVIEAPPDKLDAFLTDASRIARELRERPVTADELERARRPRVEGLQRARAGNEWWLSNLRKVQADPRAVEALRTLESDYRAITPADLQRVAREYLVDSRAYRLLVTPGPGAAPAAAAAPRGAR